MQLLHISGFGQKQEAANVLAEVNNMWCCCITFFYKYFFHLSSYSWTKPPSRCPSPWRIRSFSPFTPLRASLTSPAWPTPSTCSSAAFRATSRRASSSPGGRVSSWRRTSWCSSATRCPAFSALPTSGPRYVEKRPSARLDYVSLADRNVSAV